MTEKAKPIEVIRQQLASDNMVTQLQAALPTTLPVEKFNRVAISVIQNAPDLLEADRKTLFSAIMSAAQLGLLPDPQLGEAYFTAFKKKVALIIGYRGLLKLARQSGELSTIYAELVHANDQFSPERGTDPKISHVPVWDGDPGEITGAYAVAIFKDQSYQFEIMSISQIEAIRQNSFSKNSPAWKGIGYGEMCKKTVLRRLLKYLPLSTDPIGALASEDRMEATAQPALALAEAPARTSRLEQLKNDHAEPAAEVEVVAEDTGEVLTVDAESGEVL